MPNMKREDVIIKDKFLQRYQALLGDRYAKFEEYSLKYQRRSIRVNTLKVSVDELKDTLSKTDWKLESIPWCKEGFFIDHGTRRDAGNIPEHMLGYFYIQEASSMIPPIILDPKPGDIILDMCASPGSKSSQIAMYMENKGILISNDYKGMRMKPLGINMAKAGVTCSVLTMMDGRYFKNIEFDRILVDAPCSGTGTIRKSLKTLMIWNPNMIKRLSQQQRQLLEVGFRLLKPGGTLVYSTCSLEPEEDEGVVSWLLEKYNEAHLEEISINIVRSPAITEFDDVQFNPEVKKCLRIWPQDNDTDGFFVAKITKNL